MLVTTLSPMGIDSILPNLKQKEFVKKIISKYGKQNDSIVIFSYQNQTSIYVEILIKSKEKILIYNTESKSTNWHKVKKLNPKNYIISPLTFVDRFVANNIGKDSNTLMKIRGTICDGEYYYYYFQTSNYKKIYSYPCYDYLGGRVIPWPCLLYYSKKDKYLCGVCNMYRSPGRADNGP